MFSSVLILRPPDSAVPAGAGGVLARFAGSEAFAALIARERGKWVRVVREAGITVS